MDGAERWRDQVVDALLLTLCVGTGVALPLIMLQLGTLLSAMGAVSGSLWLALLAGVLFRRRLPFSARAMILLTVLYGAHGVGMVLAGPFSGPSIAGAIFVVMAGLLLGRNAGYVALALALASMVLAALLVTAGVLAPPPLEAGDMTRIDAWMREIIAFGVFAGLLAVTTGFVVARIERSLGETSQALKALEAEQAEKQLAQRALLDAERTVSELQRIEALGRLAGGVAHDFNNALLVLMGGIELLTDATDDAEERALLQDMFSAAEGAAQLTAQLLAYGRRDVVEPRVVQPTEVVESTVRSLRRVLPDDVVVETTIQDPPALRADPRELEQLLLNLAINARDAMPSGGTLTLGATQAPGEDLPTLQLTVSDTGTGIHPAIRGRMFEPFFTTKDAGQGTGLGLSMVFGIVQRMGGRVEVHGELGAGTTIEVLLPAGVDPKGPEGERRILRSNVVEARGTILLAEDEALVRRAMTTSLGRAGFHVVEADSAAAALEAMRAHGGPIDLLCTDGIMAGGSCKPLIDGFQEEFPSAPVLVCSGHLEEDLVRRDIATGSIAFLQKPFRGSDLVTRVADLLDTATS